MSKKYSAHTVGLFSIATLLVVILIGGFVYSYLELMSLERRYEAQLQLVANNELQTRQAELLQQTLDQSKTDREKLNSYFLNVREVANLLAVTEQYMERLGVVGEVGGIAPQPVNEIGITAVEIPYVVTGDRPNIMKLLRFMETLPYHSSVTNFAIQGNKNSSRAAAQFSIQVSLIEYDRN